jgi:hypothetical protein
MTRLTARLSPARRAAVLLASCAAALTLLALSRSPNPPRTREAADVPVAFWSWRTDAPADEEWARAAAATGAKVLFLRAGQLDYAKGRVSRIRAAHGRAPRAAKVHLVYNATRSLLKSFEQVEPGALAEAVTRTFRHDEARAASDCVEVVGLQLDLDVPTRLLARYAEVLRALRAELKPGVRLSVTGLPSWANSPDIKTVLAEVDFWVPQCYGAEVPRQLSRATPISSPREVRRTVGSLRGLGEPFYVGLAAYGYAVLYSREGQLIELRGDLDPALVAAHPALELVERRRFESLPRGRAGEAGGEWRLVYRAHAGAVIDGLVVREGEHVMLDVPSAEGLRDAARAAREEAGGGMIGLCVFRLPTEGDATALTLDEISAALADRATVPAAAAKVSHGDSPSESSGHLTVRITNTGSASAVIGDGALAVDVRVPPGSVGGVAGLQGFTTVETLCGAAAVGATVGAQELRPCGLRRANVVRLRGRAWRPGDEASAVLSVSGAQAEALTVAVRAEVDDGRAWGDEQTVKIEKVRER